MILKAELPNPFELWTLHKMGWMQQTEDGNCHSSCTVRASMHIPVFLAVTAQLGILSVPLHLGGSQCLFSY